jgi:hypothetical protein
MSKHLDSLERLCKKMQLRYGDNDDLVLQFKQELSVLREKKIKEITTKNFGRRTVDKAPPAPLSH